MHFQIKSVLNIKCHFIKPIRYHPLINLNISLFLDTFFQIWYISKSVNFIDLQDNCMFNVMLWTFPVNSETVQARSCTSRQVGDITTCITSHLFFATQSYRHFLLDLGGVQPQRRPLLRHQQARSPFHHQWSAQARQFWPQTELSSFIRRFSSSLTLTPVDPAPV